MTDSYWEDKTWKYRGMSELGLKQEQVAYAMLLRFENVLKKQGFEIESVVVKLKKKP